MCVILCCWNVLTHLSVDTVTRFGPKVGQIGTKWDKSGKFSDQIQYILAHRYQTDILKTMAGRRE